MNPYEYNKATRQAITEAKELVKANSRISDEELEERLWNAGHQIHEIMVAVRKARD